MERHVDKAVVARPIPSRHGTDLLLWRVQKVPVALVRRLELSWRGVAMNLTSFATAAVCVGFSSLTVGMGIGGADLAVPAAPPVPLAAAGSPGSALHRRRGRPASRGRGTGKYACCRAQARLGTQPGTFSLPTAIAYRRGKLTERGRLAGSFRGSPSLAHVAHILWSPSFATNDVVLSGHAGF